MSNVKYYFADNLGSGKRLWLNYTDEDLYGSDSSLLQRFEALDVLSCWGGKDKQEDCMDGSTTVSWEIPAEYVPAVKRLAEGFKRQRWTESAFWQENAKRPK